LPDVDFDFDPSNPSEPERSAVDSSVSQNDWYKINKGITKE